MQINPFSRKCYQAVLVKTKFSKATFQKRTNKFEILPSLLTVEFKKLHKAVDTMPKKNIYTYIYIYSTSMRLIRC